MKAQDVVVAIKNWFGYRISGQKPAPSFIEDAAVLKKLASETPFLKKRSKKNYWYYFPRQEEDAPIVLHLLQKNGVWALLHHSRYARYPGQELRMSFRISTSYFVANPEVKKFVDLITGKEEISVDKAVINKQIQDLRNLFNQNQR